VNQTDPMHELISRLDNLILGDGSENTTKTAASHNLPLPVKPEATTSRSSNSSKFMDSLRSLSKVGVAFQALGNSRTALYKSAISAAHDLFSGHSGALYLKNQEGGFDLVWSDLEELSDELERPLRWALDKCVQNSAVLCEAFPQAKEVLLAAAPLIRGRPVQPGKDRRKIIRPLEEDLLGGLVLKVSEPLEERERLLLKSLVQHLSTAILRDDHLRRAINDPLTGTFTRTQLNRELSRFRQLFESARSPFVVLLCNVDRFKEVNEDHGHSTGDTVLRELASTLSDNLRDEDLLFRYGGDTFAVLLPDTDVNGCEIVAEKLRSAVLNSSYNNSALTLSLSLGSACCPTHATREQELLKRADQALHQAKSLGRNQACLWSPNLTKSAPRHDNLAGILTGDFASDYQHVDILLATAAAMASGEDLDDLLQTAVDRVIAATDAERGALMLSDEDGILTTSVARSRHKENLELQERFSRSVPERVLRTRESLCMVVNSKPNESISESFVQLDLKTVMCAPLMARGRCIGVLYTDGKALTGELREAMLPFFCALAGTIALAVENARLRERLKNGS
jgi:diguanylate cyclase (GGDEF)-like protein